MAPHLSGLERDLRMPLSGPPVRVGKSGSALKNKGPYFKWGHALASVDGWMMGLVYLARDIPLYLSR